MRDFKLDPTTGDLDLSTGDIQFVTGDECIKQHLWIRLRLWFGEWFLDNSLGVDYLGKVLVKNPDLGRAETEIRRVILATQGVTRLVRYSQTYTPGSRTLHAAFVVQTSDGTELALEGALTR